MRFIMILIKFCKNYINEIIEAKYMQILFNCIWETQNASYDISISSHHTFYSNKNVISTIVISKKTLIVI